MQVLVILVALLGSSRSRADPAKLTFPYPSAPLIPIAPLGTKFEYNEVVPVPPLARASLGGRSGVHKEQHGETYVPPSSSGGYNKDGAPGAFAPGTGTSGCATCKGASHGSTSYPGTSQGSTSHGSTSQGISTHTGASQGTNNPCSPTPCGPNTECRVDERNPYIAKCLCKDGYVPIGHTINGCQLKAECTSDAACTDRQQCVKDKCVDACAVKQCGRDYQCVVKSHTVRCACYPGYVERASGNGCELIPKQQAAPVDPCATDPCGANTECKPSYNAQTNVHKAVCACKYRHEGNPLTGCIRAECYLHEDCPVRTHVCKGRKCMDPCDIPDICGIEAKCHHEGRQPICSCPAGRQGNPFKSCEQRIEICSENTCARGAICTPQNGRAVCSCPPNYIGEPLHGGCKPECLSNVDCPDGFECYNDKCTDPCNNPRYPRPCGTDAICKAVNGQAECSCPKFYLGHPKNRCYPECTAHSHCPNHKACYELKCIDPCTKIPTGKACGVNALCRVDNHSAVCSCPKTHTGHPYEVCRPFTPADLCEPNPCGHLQGSSGQATCTPGHDQQGNDRPVCSCPRGYIGDPLRSCIKGECTEGRDCNQNESCYNYKCQDACTEHGGSVCGTNAQCRARAHVPVCSCLSGYEGDPLTYCSRTRQAPRISVGRTNMMNMKNWKK